MKKDRAREITQDTMQDRIGMAVDGAACDIYFEDYDRKVRLRKSRPQYDTRRLHHSTARPKVVETRPKNRAR